MDNNTTELPLKGKGVEAVRIKHIDDLADDYRIYRDRRIAALGEEINAKQKLIEALHSHDSELMRPDGTLAYRYGDIAVTLEPGKEKLKVTDVSAESDE